MKYGKLENENLLIKEVENGMEVGGSLTEQQIIEQGYKPYCEVEKPKEVDYYTYKEYETCIVQEWGVISEEMEISKESLLLFLEKLDSSSVVTLTLSVADYAKVLEDEEIQQTLKQKPLISIVTL